MLSIYFSCWICSYRYWVPDRALILHKPSSRLLLSVSVSFLTLSICKWHRLTWASVITGAHENLYLMLTDLCFICASWRVLFQIVPPGELFQIVLPSERYFRLPVSAQMFWSENYWRIGIPSVQMVIGLTLAQWPFVHWVCFIVLLFFMLEDSVPVFGNRATMWVTKTMINAPVCHFHHVLFVCGEFGIWFWQW